jgi:Ca2+-binding EF-hand superfamily protein
MKSHAFSISSFVALVLALTLSLSNMASAAKRSNGKGNAGANGNSALAKADKVNRINGDVDLSDQEGEEVESMASGLRAKGLQALKKLDPSAGRGNSYEQRLAARQRFIQRFDENGDGQVDKMEVTHLATINFDELDEDSDASLSAQELQNSLSEELADSLATRFANLDVNSDGEIGDGESFNVQNFLKRQGADSNQDGAISEQEYLEYNLGELTSEALDRLDSDENGEVSFEELQALYVDSVEAEMSDEAEDN